MRFVYEERPSDMLHVYRFEIHELDMQRADLNDMDAAVLRQEAVNVSDHAQTLEVLVRAIERGMKAPEHGKGERG